MEEINETEIQKIVKKRGLKINRIPEYAKEAFMNRAKLEFEDDYGMTLAAMVKESGEYNLLKQMFFENNLNVQLILGNPIGFENSDQGEEIKTGSGNTIRKGRSS